MDREPFASIADFVERCQNVPTWSDFNNRAIHEGRHVPGNMSIGIVISMVRQNRVDLSGLQFMGWMHILDGFHYVMVQGIDNDTLELYAIRDVPGIWPLRNAINGPHSQLIGTISYADFGQLLAMD